MAAHTYTAKQVRSLKSNSNYFSIFFYFFLIFRSCFMGNTHFMRSSFTQPLYASFENLWNFHSNLFKYYVHWTSNKLVCPHGNIWPILYIVQHTAFETLLLLVKSTRNWPFSTSFVFFLLFSIAFTSIFGRFWSCFYRLNN